MNKITNTTLLITLALVFSACLKTQINNNKWALSKLVTVADVGQDNLSDSIAKVKAPFSTILFSKPDFPTETLSITPSGQKDNTKQIQTAIDNLALKGGGTVVLSSDVWHSGRIELKTNINLHFEDGATLYFSGKVEDFRPAVFTRIEGIEVNSLGACIYANGANNIAITGKGRLIGPPKDSEIRERILTTDVIDNVVNPNTPIKERVYDGTSQDWIFPPMFISPINCTNIYIEGISLENTAFWNIVPIYCDGVIIRGVKVNSIGIPRGDGIDIESSRNVLIEYCTLSCGDDCFTMKAGRGPDGIRVNRPTENVVVRYSLAEEGHGGITCGSETAGMIRNLYVHDCVFNNTGVGIRFKTRRPRGGGGENLTYERLRMNLRYTAFKWDMLGGTGSVGELANRLPEREVNELTPRYTNIHAKDLLIENCTHFVKVLGIPESPVNKLLLENIETNCTNFIFAHDIKNATFKNIILNGNDSIIQLTDSRNIRFDNIQFNTDKAPVKLVISGSKSDSIVVNSCSNMDNIQWLNK